MDIRLPRLDILPRMVRSPVESALARAPARRQSPGPRSSGGNFLVSWVVRRSRGRAIHAQEAGCIYRPGTMTPSLKIAASPILAFFDELRVFGFVEGQNLKVDGGGYGLRDEQLPMHPPGADRSVICRRALE
jgi:hypothetical protein